MSWAQRIALCSFRLQALSVLLLLLLLRHSARPGVLFFSLRGDCYDSQSQEHREPVSETEIIVGDYASVGSSNSAGMKVQLLSRSATAERGNSLYIYREEEAYCDAMQGNRILFSLHIHTLVALIITVNATRI